MLTVDHILETWMNQYLSISIAQVILMVEFILANYLLQGSMESAYAQLFSDVFFKGL